MKPGTANLFLRVALPGYRHSKSKNRMPIVLYPRKTHRGSPLRVEKQFTLLAEQHSLSRCAIHPNRLSLVTKRDW